MPRLDQDMQSHALSAKGFGFSATRIEALGASGYTLVTIVRDNTGSVAPFKDELDKMELEAIAACKKSPRSENILVRLLRFSSHYGLFEVHGFKPLADIDPASYPDQKPYGATPLYDAVYSAVGATNAYGKTLRDSDYDVNAIFIVVSDGEETGESAATMRMIKDEIEKARTTESLESILCILVGVNDTLCKVALDRFQKEAGFDRYISTGDVTPSKLAKLADFISQSISSQSQALGTGGPSAPVSLTIP